MRIKLRHEKKQIVYFLISIFVVSSGLLLSSIYRPYIYSNDINDLGFADTIGSLVSVIGFCSFLWSFKDFSDKKKNYHIIWAVFIYSVIWEPLGLLGIHGTFDWKDIFAVIVSGLITYALKNFIESKFKLTDKENE